MPRYRPDSSLEPSEVLSGSKGLATAGPGVLTSGVPRLMTTCGGTPGSCCCCCGFFRLVAESIRLSENGIVFDSRPSDDRRFISWPRKTNGAHTAREKGTAHRAMIRVATRTEVTKGAKAMAAENWSRDHVHAERRLGLQKKRLGFVEVAVEIDVRSSSVGERMNQGRMMA